MRQRPDVEALFDPDRRQKAVRYAAAQRRWTVVASLVPPLYLLAWLLTGWHVQLEKWLMAVIPYPLARVALAFLIIGAGLWALDTLVAIPGQRLARQYGLSVQDWESWLTDRLKVALIAGLLGLLVIVGIYFLIGTGDPLWWLWAALIVILLQLVLSVLAPVVIAPLFFRFEPLQDEAVTRRLLALAERAGVSATGIYRFDMSRRTRAANAAVVGMGTTRRIIIADTLLDNFSIDEVESVLAHELAHHVHRDLMWAVTLSSVLVVAGMWVISEVLAWVGSAWGISPTSPRTLPVVLLTGILFAWATSPLMNLWSRTREMLADMFAVLVTGKGEVYARALARLIDQNLGELWPPSWYVWLFATHPPPGDRVAMALDIGKEQKDQQSNLQSPTS